MASRIAVLGFVAVALSLETQAAEFALAGKAIAPEQAPACPGGGAVGSLNKHRPDGLAHEPPAVSRYPLYGLTGIVQRSQGVFRLDESKGTGKGYDRLIVDLNGNGDLRDDPQFEGLGKDRPTPLPDWVVFGPIEPTPGDMAGPWRPSIYAIAELRADEVVLFPDRNLSAGILRIKSAWYLEAEVDVDGVKEKIGIVDADRDLQLTGDAPKGGDGKYFAVNRMDAVLRDRDGSGRFELGLCETEIDEPTDLIGIGRNLYRLTIAGDLRSIRLERYEGRVGQLAIAGRPDMIRAVTLLRETSKKQEEHFKPVLIDGKAVLPVGSYKLLSCVAAGNGDSGSTAMSMGWIAKPGNPFRIRSNRTTELKCGPPLELRIEAAKTASGQSPSRTQQVDINVALLGTAGEKYVRHASGRDITIHADPPRFRILDDAGNEVASGRFEYG